jgi:hypothetical protein
MKKAILLLSTIVAAAMVAQVGAVSQLELKWAFNTSDQFPGSTFGAGHQGCHTVWDIDGDGKNEVLFGTRRGDARRFWCITEDGKLQWMYPPLGEAGLPGDPWGVSLVDVNNDGIYEAAIAGRGGRLSIVDGAGATVWTWMNLNEEGGGVTMLGPPQAYDVDGDGNIEFFIADNDGFVHRVDNQGNLIWKSAKFAGTFEGHPTLADIDQDEEIEIMLASQDFNLYVLKTSTGAEEWRFDTGAKMQTNANFVIDVNNDDEYECIVWNDAGEVYVVTFYGIEFSRWTHPRGALIRLTPALGDVDGDGSMDMAFMSNDAIHMIDIGAGTPTTKWEQNISLWAEQGMIPDGAQSNAWSNYPIIADITGDGNLEVLWVGPYPIVTDGKTGELIAYYWNENVRVNNRQENGGWWGDVDMDGKSEWIVELSGPGRGADTLVYCLTMNGKFPAESPWPEYVHSAYPAEYQQAQDWLTLKGAYSKGCWFPMVEEEPVPEFVLPSIAGLLCIGLLKRRK